MSWSMLPTSGTLAWLTSRTPRASRSRKSRMVNGSSRAQRRASRWASRPRPPCGGGLHVDLVHAFELRGRCRTVPAGGQGGARRPRNGAEDRPPRFSASRSMPLRTALHARSGPRGRQRAAPPGCRAAVRSAFDDLVEEDDLIIPLAYGHREVVYAGELTGQLGELVVVGGEEGPGAHLLVEVFDDGLARARPPKAVPRPTRPSPGSSRRRC